MAFEPFMKWGLGFMGLVKSTARYIGNQYIIIVTNYTNKWVETKTFPNNMVKSTIKFIYEQIITHFGCPTHLVSDWGGHFINKTIEMLVEEFIISHHKSTTYNPQGDGQAKLTNKTLGKILAKLDVNQTNWDAMLVITLWAYRIAYKITTQYTPFKLVYGTQPIMLAQFGVPTKRVHDLPQEDLDKAIKVRMEDLFRLDKLIGKLKKISTIFSCCTKNKGMKEEG